VTTLDTFDDDTDVVTVAAVDDNEGMATESGGTSTLSGMNEVINSNVALRKSDQRSLET
jgi:hypothetical protein